MRGSSTSKKVLGVGYNSRGLRVSDSNYKPLRSYEVWRAMLNRGYSRTFKDKNPSYENVSVCSGWFDYCEFLEWYENQPNGDGWQLDKDLIKKGNQIYSPDHCCILPIEINSLLKNRSADRGKYPVGVYYREKYNNYQSGGGVYLGVYSTPEEAFNVYKEWKENKLLTLSRKYSNILDGKVIEAMKVYKIEITD